ncbi:MAG: DUF5689 domain-containing protein [Bacteroidota bacterium]
MKNARYFWMVFSYTIFSCVADPDFEIPSDGCDTVLEANTTFGEVKALYQGETIQIQEDLVITGFVTSSDRAGNFFNVLYFQDDGHSATEGFQLEMDLRDSHLFFPEGSKILIKLKGLYLGQSQGVYKIGGTFTVFGNISVGRLPTLQIGEHVYLACDVPIGLQPLHVTIDDFKDGLVGTLVQLDSVEVIENELGLTFAEFEEETERTLVDCADREMILRNSGFADFQPHVLPGANGSIKGILLKEDGRYQLAVRDMDDISFANERCADLMTAFTSNTIFISELADPNNNSGARFVELYNSASEPLDLNGWILRRYTNANEEVSATIDLTGQTIGAESTFVISPNASEFEVVYGFSPDMGVGANSPADSNGDDNLELVDPFGTVIDVFGRVGEDGSGTNHEFEDGRAVRKLGIVMANTVYTFSEWTVFNDTGGAGTTNQPQNAPEDFTPGIRN